VETRNFVCRVQWGAYNTYHYKLMFITSLILLCRPPPLHMTTSKVMVIVWRLRGNTGNVVPLQWAQFTETVDTARLVLEFVFLCVLG